MYSLYFEYICIFIILSSSAAMCQEEQDYKFGSSIVGGILLLEIVCNDDNSTEVDERVRRISRNVGGYDVPKGDKLAPFEKLKFIDHDYSKSYDVKSKSRSYSSKNDDSEEDSTEDIFLDVNVKKLEHSDRLNSSIESRSLGDTSELYFSKGSGSHPVITNGTIDGNLTVEVEINCTKIVIGPSAVSQNVENLSIESIGRVTFDPDWANSSKLETIEIYSETGLRLPVGCSWLPTSAKVLDLSRSRLKALSLVNCPNSTLEKIILGLSPSLSSLSLCLPSLRSLTVTWSSIDKIKTKCQSGNGNGNVDQLDLSKNKLVFFSTCGWASLVRLDLNSNKISQVDFGTCSCSSLTTIDLSYNRLTASPENLPKSLHKINLSENRIKKLAIFNPEIQEVDLSHNSLRSIGKGMFKNAWMLLTLDLSHNQIDTVYGHSFYGLHELQSLDLSRNHITHVRHEALLPLQSLQKLNLDHNQLKQLDFRLLASLSSSLELKVKHNPWRCSCHLLAKLHRVMRSHCKPHCHNVDVLECKEGSSSFSAQSILQMCIDARSSEIPSKKRVNENQFQKHIKDSDEDTSEEDVTEDSSKMSPYAVASLVFVIVLPFVILGARTLYLKRKTICGRFNCLAPQSSAVTIPQWSRDKEDTDSETEM